jgi:hypothetical protein
MRAKVAIIDVGSIDKSTVCELGNDTVFYSVKNCVVTTVPFFQNEETTHNSVCTRIFTKYAEKAPNYNISLLSDAGIHCSIDDLLVAFDFCIELGVSLISLSLGSKKLCDVSRLKNAIERLDREKILLIASNSNDEHIAFPAAFSHCIGVRYTKDIIINNGEYLFYDDPFDGMNVVVPYVVPDFCGNPCNSYATACFAGYVHKQLCVHKIENNTEKMDWIRANAKFANGVSSLDITQLIDFALSTIIVYCNAKGTNAYAYIDMLCEEINNDGYGCVILSSLRKTKAEDYLYGFDTREDIQTICQLTGFVHRLCRMCRPDVLLIEANQKIDYNENIDIAIVESMNDLPLADSISFIFNPLEYSPSDVWSVCKQHFCSD